MSSCNVIRISHFDHVMFEIEISDQYNNAYDFEYCKKLELFEKEWIAFYKPCDCNCNIFKVLVPFEDEYNFIQRVYDF